ncbi:MAG: ABC transporter substrate-binding protein [Desulfobacterales bacterium]|nr:ABC transporter substrate-binding protein [Desulfobacterales bacterium]
MKRKYFTLAAILLAIMLLLPFEALAAGAKDTVEAQIKKMLTRMKEPSFKQLQRDAKIAEIQQIINEVFDFNELSRRTLGRDWKKFKPDQQKEFISLFEQILQNVYADRILAYTSETIEFGKETELKKGRVEVESYIVTLDNKKIPLFYRLTNKSGQWRVYDVVIEGISMIKNYRGQFREILKTKTPEDLLKTMRKKAKEKPAG